jgi:hypothetical protein
MVTVRYEDLSLAFDFVSSGAPMERQAYISLDTGKIYWVSDLALTEDELPDDFEESDRYLEIPHKNDLDLGRDLALRFAERELPEAYDRVAAYFGHRGAYRRFKDYLEETGHLDKWYAFEAEQVDRALRAWCEANQIDIAPETPSA